jgi:hypothetical protein
MKKEGRSDHSCTAAFYPEQPLLFQHCVSDQMYKLGINPQFQVQSHSVRHSAYLTNQNKYVPSSYRGKVLDRNKPMDGNPEVGAEGLHQYLLLGIRLFLPVWGW